MLKKFFTALVFASFMFNFTPVFASTSSIMLDAEDGKIMYENNADELRYPASLTKLMTLYITFNALENNRLKLTDKLKVSRVAASRSPSKLGVKAGSTISVKDAITAVIVKSANDCATVLAEHFSPTEADFAKLMTDTAKKLGMKHTVFKNASGLPNSKQKTTARDMSVLAMAIYHHFPQYYKWFSQKSFTYQGQKITGHNHLLDTFKGADGMKTGYTAASGFNIITSAKRGNKRVIAVTMGHKFLNERDKKVALMMDLGLDHLANNKVINVAELTGSINGKTNPQVKVAKNNITRKTAVTVTKTAAKPTIKSSSVKQYASITNGKYALQVGSFSDYSRAKNYALQIKNKIAKKYAIHDIMVEKISSPKGELYRSKVIGFAKNDANKICKDMRKSNQACLVVTDNSKLKVAQR